MLRANAKDDAKNVGTLVSKKKKKIPDSRPNRADMQATGEDLEMNMKMRQPHDHNSNADDDTQANVKGPRILSKKKKKAPPQQKNFDSSGSALGV